jgi:APA family basic amino acid/polyamine antiporter
MEQQPTQSGSMVKSLSTWNLLSIGIGAVIGWSWVIYAGYWSVVPGTLGGILAFVIAALLCSLIGVIYAELTAAFPKIGVDVSVSFLALGNLPAIIVSWCVLYLWMSFVLVEAIMFPMILGNLGIHIPEFGHLYTLFGMPVMLSNILASLLFNTLFAYINFRGIRVAGWVQTAAVAILAVAAVFFFGSGFALGDASNAQPLFTGIGGLATVLLIVPGFLSGFNAIPQAVEETNVPPRTVGRLVLYTVWGSALFYILIIVGLGFAAPLEARAGEGLVVIEAVGLMFGGSKIAMFFVTFAALLGMLTTWNAAYIAGSRFIFGLSRAKILPPAFTMLHWKYGTPHAAILFLFLLGTVAPFLGTAPTVYVGLMNIASFGLVITWLFVALSFIKLRQTMPDINRPYRVPAGKVTGWISIVYCIAYLFLYTPWGPSGLLPVEWGFIGIIVLAAIIVWFTWNNRGGKISFEERKVLLTGED